MSDALIFDGVRTPFGRYGGVLSSVRADDLAAIPLRALCERHPAVDWSSIDDVILGCANQAGEDNRNVARMALLLAGVPESVPGTTINRLCGSGMDAIAMASRAIKSGDAQLLMAGGVESMSRAPFVMGKAGSAFTRDMKVEDTTLGWRFVNPAFRAAFGVDTMPETGENVAEQFGVTRQDQDAFALRSQQKTAAAIDAGILAEEIVPVTIPQKKGSPVVVSVDEHPRRDTTLPALEGLKPVVRPNGTITAGNAAGINDGAAALLVGSAEAGKQYGLEPMGRVVAAAAAGVAPRIMGIGPVPATRKVLELAKLTLADMNVIELNEAFASQAVAVLRELGLRDDEERVNPNGGAISIGHPLGASGARLVINTLRHLGRTGGRYGLCTMCIGVGQGIAMIVERMQ